MRLFQYLTQSTVLTALLLSFTMADDTAAPPPRKTLGEILKENGGRLPTSFGDLIKASGGSEDDVILIPRGRSLVKDDTDYNSPRILLSPQASSEEVPAKVIITYTPKTDSMEIMSWNSGKRTYDFLEVKNYSDANKQKFVQPEEGKCTTCHFNGRLHFTPQPWADVLDFKPADFEHPRERETPKKIADALKDIPGYPKYYGIDLEKYKIASSKRAQSFVLSVDSSERFRRTLSVCSQLCKSGYQKADQNCRRTLLVNSIETAARNKAPVPFSDIAKQNEVVSSMAFQFEKNRLLGKLARANNVLIPERDPETERLYHFPRNEEERKALSIRQHEYQEEHGLDTDTNGNLPEQLLKIPFTDEEQKNFQLGKNLPKETSIESSDVVGAFVHGCLMFNPSEVAALNKMGVKKLLEEISNGSSSLIESYLANGVFNEENSLNALIKSQRKKVSFLNDEELSCKLEMNPILDQNTNAMVKGTQLALLKALPLKEQAHSFQAYCVECHTGKPGDEVLLPYESIISGSELGKTEEAVKTKMKMIDWLSRCIMPPPDAAIHPPDDVRKKMVESLGGNADSVKTCNP